MTMQHFLITATHHRVELLASTALPSLVQQSNQDFNWILINDGHDLATRELADEVKHSAERRFSFTYLEIEHPSGEAGFGLCHARNSGLAAAISQSAQTDRPLVSYLDDDNWLAPDFVAHTKQFFQENSTVCCSMMQQLRQRQVVQDRKIIRRGNPFISPAHGTEVKALIQQQALFDSNGFTHLLHQAPQWNPRYRIFADYEYFLQCIQQWGRECFKLIEQALVNYTQSSEGIIGRSSYGDWAEELRSLLNNNYPVLSPDDRKALLTLLHRWQMKAQLQRPIPAFATVEVKSDEHLQPQPV